MKPRRPLFVVLAVLFLFFNSELVDVVRGEPPEFKRCKSAADVWFVLDGGSWISSDTGEVASGVEEEWNALQENVLPSFFPALEAQEPSEKFALTLHVVQVIGEDSAIVAHSDVVSTDREARTADVSELIDAAEWNCAPGFEDPVCNTTANWAPIVREVHDEYYLTNADDLPFDDNGEVRGGNSVARCLVFLWMSPSTNVSTMNDTAQQWFGWGIEGQWESQAPPNQYVPDCAVYTVSLLPLLSDYPSFDPTSWAEAFDFQESQNIWSDQKSNGTQFHRLLQSWHDVGNGTGLLLGLLEDRFETGFSCWYVTNTGVTLAPWFALIAVIGAGCFVGYWRLNPSIPFPVEETATSPSTDDDGGGSGPPATPKTPSGVSSK